jgi:hypothetical protein
MGTQNSTRHALTAAERVQLSLDVIDDNARILRDPLLTAKERRAYLQSSANARKRLAEAQAELATEAA